MAWFKNAQSEPVPTQVTFARFLQLVEYDLSTIEGKPFAQALFNGYRFTFSMNDPTEARFLLVHGISDVNVPEAEQRKMVAACNAWNVETAWGSAYVEPDETGQMKICSDVSIPLAGGLTDEQLKTWIELSLSCTIDCLDSLSKPLQQEEE